MAAKSVKSEPGKPCVIVIHGKDNYLVGNECERLVDELIPEQHRQMGLYQPAADKADIVEVLDELRTLPFLAERRVVVIKGADDFVSSNREILEKYLDNPSNSGVLILTVSTWAKNTRLAKKVSKSKVCRLIEVAEIKRWNLDKYVMGYCKDRHGKRLSPSAAGVLVELVGDEPGRVCSEVDKLAMFVGSAKTISEGDIESLIGHNRIFGAFEVIDAMSAGQAGQAVERLRRMFDADRSSEYSVVGAFAYHFRKLFTGKSLVEKGADRQEVVKKCGLWGGKEQQFYDQLGRFSLKGLGSIMSHLARLDFYSKTGQCDIKTAIEQMVVKLAVMK